MAISDKEKRKINQFAELEEVPFFRGKLVVYQPKKGFRFGIDSLLLADFLELKRGERVLEIGAGTGIISFTLLLRFPHSKIYLLEIDPLCVSAISCGISANSFEERAFLIRGDALKAPFKSGVWDVIFANPPYFKEGTGRASPKELRNLARRERTLNLDSLLETCSKLLKNGGRLYLIFTALRFAELIYKLKTFQLEPKVIRLVHSYPEERAKLVLIKAIKGAKEEVLVERPLYIYETKGGDYSEEVRKILNLSYI